MHTAIIPNPARLEFQEGAFAWGPETRILVGGDAPRTDWVARYLAARVEAAIGLGAAVERVSGEERAKACVLLTTEGADAALGPEGYELAAAPELIVVRSTAPHGLLHGVQSLCQLLPSRIDAKDPLQSRAECVVPCLRIEDRPRYRWRGMHLDVCRHFMPVEFVKRFIDLLAVHKFNVFHWHLTEDQGWRIEIERYPKLTEIGAWRTEASGERYGGFYTRDEVRAVVEYARERFITVVPEIEMPGHAVAMLAAHPELGCTGGPYKVETTWGVFDDVLCAGKDAVFEFVEGVLDEVLELFPSEFIHIGGDEAPKTRWKACPACQERMRAEGLEDEEALQSYFIRRVEKYLNARGRRLIGWDEILEGGLAPNATVMSWRGSEGGVAAARAGHDVVMTPLEWCYFSRPEEPERSAPDDLAPLTLERAYAFEPTPPEMTPEQAAHVLGAQGCIWTERIETPEQVERRAFPRACALAEAVWSPPERRDWAEFQKRMACHYRRLDAMGVRYDAP